jgi:uncharacterized membrane protein YqjE
MIAMDGIFNPTGILDSLQRLGASLLGLAQARAELVALELQEEKLRAIDLMTWLAVAAAFAFAAVLVAVGTLALFLWQKAGFVGLIGMAVASALAAATLFALRRRRLLREPLPFSATTAEFRKDIEWLRRKSTR